MSNVFTTALFDSLSREHVNSNFALALVPVPERARVSLRAGYLSNTGWRPSDALTQAVNEWRQGHMRLWR